MAVILVGIDDEGTSTTQVPARLVLCKSNAVASGTATTLRIFSKSNGNAKIAIYTDNTGVPYTLLGAATIACTANQWNEGSIASADITSGAAYWRGVITDATGVRTLVTATADARIYKDYTYATYSYPATFDSSGFGSSTAAIDCISAYGDPSGGAPATGFMTLNKGFW